MVICPCAPWCSAATACSIGSAVFAQLTRVLNTQTDTQTTLLATFVAIDRVQAMRPNNVMLVHRPLTFGTARRDWGCWTPFGAQCDNHYIAL